MAGSKSPALENLIIQFMFKNNAGTLATPNNALWVALFTAAPSDTSAGTEVSAAVDTSYTRVQVTAANWTYSARSGSNPAKVVNAADINFPAVTGTGVTVRGWAIMSAQTSGTMYYWGDTSATDMAVADTPRFVAGALVITED